MSVRRPDDVLARIRLGGARVDLTTAAHLDGAVRARLSGLEDRPLFVASANLDHVRHFGERSGRAQVFDRQRGVDWQVLLDGMPLVWAARWLAGAKVPLLAGSDLLGPVLHAAEEQGARLGVLGGSATMHRALRLRLEQSHPQLSVACTLDPTREQLSRPESRQVLADEVRRAGIDLLVVALGKPRQEEFLLEHGPSTGVRVAVAFGAAADFYAGTEQRAPSSLRGTGFEWVHRLAREPRRLSSRYLVRGPADLADLARYAGLWAPALPLALEAVERGGAPVPLGVDRRDGERRRRTLAALPQQRRSGTPGPATPGEQERAALDPAS